MGVRTKFIIKAIMENKIRQYINCLVPCLLIECPEWIKYDNYIECPCYKCNEVKRDEKIKHQRIE